LVATADWAEESGKTLKAEIRVISKEDLNKISNQKTPQGVLAIFENRIISFLSRIFRHG